MRARSLITVLSLCVPLLALVNIAVGSVPISLGEVLAALTGGGVDEISRQIVLMSRLPQSLTAVACGAGLAVAGLEMQTLFGNPLAGPSVLGVSAAASLGVAVLVLLSGAMGFGLLSGFSLAGNTLLTLAATLGALAAMGLIALLSTRLRDNVTLLVAGVLLGYISTAVVGVLKYFSSEEDVHTFVIWGLGSFSRVTGGQVWVFVALMAVLLPLSALLVKPLNILLLGEDYARNLGLNVGRARTLCICSSGILTAVCTAYCGPVMFLGLAVPHICRRVFRTADHRTLLPATAVCGALLALVCNLIARLPGLEGALPVNSVTALIGAPVALRVILRRK